jgi:hypothetical protein
MTLLPSLEAAEQGNIAVRRGDGITMVRAESWLGSQRALSQAPYLDLLRHRLEVGSAPVHPLHLQSFRAALLHPSVLYAAGQNSGRATLLSARTRRPLVMLIPTELNARSNGHACMLTLALQLHQAGHSVHLLPFKPYTFFRNYLPNLPRIYRQLSFIADPVQVPDAVLLVPESAPRVLVQRLRQHYKEILWWLLAPAGLLTPFWPDIRRGDRLVAFSEFALPEQDDYLFVHPKSHPLLDKAERTHTPQPPQKLQVALYTGKGRLKVLPPSLHRQLLAYDVVQITRVFPRTKTDLILLLENSRGLISCDPMTNLFLEAANLGVPTFLPGGNPFPRRAFERFPADLRDFVTDSPDSFISWIKQEGPLRKLPQRPLFSKSAKASTLVDLFTLRPEPLGSRVYYVDEEILQQLKRYRQRLLQSRTIQTERDGQSLSSAFSHQYVLSIKAPYLVHHVLCRMLALLDLLGDLLTALGLFRPLRPLIHQIRRWVRIAFSPCRSILSRVIR